MDISRRLVLGMAAVLPVAPAAWGEDPAVAFEAHDPNSRRTLDHGAWDRLLAARVRPGPDGVNRVDYAGLKAQDAGALASYLETLQNAEPAGLARAEQFAYWANLYNALTVHVVIEAWPVRSIREIGGSLFSPGPWKDKRIAVTGRALSLDDIEHGILRRIWREPRVHYAVNCASYSCPNLPLQAFTGARLEAMLEAGARAYVNHPRGVRIKGGRVYTSSIYRWYREDFGGTRAGVLDHLRQYAEGETARGLAGADTIAGDDYDWSLNGA